MTRAEIGEQMRKAGYELSDTSLRGRLTKAAEQGRVEIVQKRIIRSDGAPTTVTAYILLDDL